MNRREPIGFNFTRTSMWPLWFSVLLSTCILSVGALRFTFSVLNIIYKWVHHIKLLCLSLSVLPVDMWVRVCHSAVYTCMFVRLYACGCVCLRAGFFVVRLPGLLSAPTPHPPVSCSLANPHTLSFSLSLSPFHSPSSSPARSPSSSLCNNSADLVSACSGLPVEFYSRLPSWLLRCSKTQAEKHDWGFFSPLSHHYGLIPSPFFCSPKQIGPF